jgi:hypothetical protein
MSLSPLASASVDIADHGWPGAGPLEGDLGAVLRSHVLHQPILSQRRYSRSLLSATPARHEAVDHDLAQENMS